MGLLLIAPLVSFVSGKLILVIAAVVPAIVLLWYVYKADRLESEPKGLIGQLLKMGIISTFIAVMLERLGTGIIGLFFDKNSLIYSILLYFVVVGLSEEASKFVVLDRIVWNSPYFNCKFDGVLYAVSVSLGFALWENISYVFQFGFSTALLRAVTAIPGHACFGVFMGFWYALAKRSELTDDSQMAKSARRLAVICPALIHGLYDFIACLTSSTFVFVAYIVIMFIAAFLLARRLSKTDRYLSDR